MKVVSLDRALKLKRPGFFAVIVHFGGKLGTRSGRA